MKRLVALMIAVIMVCALSLTAFAEISPTASTYWNINVSVNGDGSAKTSIATIDPEDPSVVTLTAVEGGSPFDHWEIIGDYEIIEGSLKSLVIKIRPSSDISAIAVFSDGSTQPQGDVTPGSTQAGNTSGTSPKTGDMTFVVLSILLAAAAICAFACKKVRG